jgi:hypothetical protein
MARVECRRGALGLGPNLAEYPLEVSQVGMRLVVNTPLTEGEEVEVVIDAQSYGGPVKRMANVTRSVLAKNGWHCVSLQFQSQLSYEDLQRVSQPPRVLG